MRRDASETARRVQAEVPLPETVDDLDAASRRRIEREAAAAGLLPEVYYRRLRAEREAEAAFDPDAVAKAARRRHS